MTNKVTVIFYVLCMLMKNIIVSDLDGATVVTLEDTRSLLSGTLIQARSQRSHKSLEVVSVRARYYDLSRSSNML